MNRRQIPIKTDPGSFKDPSGCVFYYKGKVYRSVASESGEFYINLIESAFFQELMRCKYVIPTWLVDLSNAHSVIEKYGSETTFFAHEQVEFLTYAYEWPVSMLSDAAIRTLDLLKILLSKGLSLKDATPYNIQFRCTHPFFIDLCSIENASNNGIWIAYNQFCQTFLYPLLMFQLRASNLNAIYLSHMDGITLNETVQALGLRPFLKYGLGIDYFIPALITKLKQYRIVDLSKKHVCTSRTFSNSAEIQSRMASRLRRHLDKISSKKSTSNWIDYTKSCFYTDKEYRIKQDFIESCLRKYKPKRVLDLGCNIGDFSIMAAKHNCDVVALDKDHECINHLYNTSKANNNSILPLCIDIANPSPSVGWLNEERPSFAQRARGQFDCVFALALIHHLMITNRIPLTEIVLFLRQLTSRFVVVEYIGPSDSKFQELLKYRTENYHDFDMKHFEAITGSCFSILEKTEITDQQKGQERCLYLMEACL